MSGRCRGGPSQGSGKEDGRERSDQPSAVCPAGDRPRVRSGVRGGAPGGRLRRDAERGQRLTRRNCAPAGQGGIAAIRFGRPSRTMADPPGPGAPRVANERSVVPAVHAILCHHYREHLLLRVNPEVGPVETAPKSIHRPSQAWDSARRWCGRGSRGRSPDPCSAASCSSCVMRKTSLGKEHVADLSDVCKARLAEVAAVGKTCRADVEKQCSTERRRIKKVACIRDAITNFGDDCKAAIAAVVTRKK